MTDDSEQFLKDAQTSFRLAGSASTLQQTEYYAAIGRDYLRLAHDAAKVEYFLLPPGR